MIPILAGFGYDGNGHFPLLDCARSSLGDREFVAIL